MVDGRRFRAFLRPPTAVLLGVAALAGLLVLLAEPSEAVTNGDFEAGSLSGWTLDGTPSPPMSTTATGTASWGFWTRDVAPAYLETGSYGIKMECKESGMSAGGKWWCNANIVQTLASPTDLELSFKLLRTTSYWGADLFVQFSTPSGFVRYVFDSSTSNYAVVGAGGFAIGEAPGLGVWHQRCLPVLDDFMKLHGTAMTGPVTVSFVTYADETHSEVWLDNIKKTSCSGGPPPPVPPIADFTWLPKTPCYDETIVFDDLSLPGTAPLWKTWWDFGDGTPPLDLFAPAGNVSHKFPGPGSYLVTLTAIDTDSLEDKAQKTVTVCNEPPMVEGGGDRVVVAGHTVQFEVDSTDPEGEATVLGLAGTPPVAAEIVMLDPSSAFFHWPTTEDDVGLRAVTFVATDPYGATGSDTVLIEVVPPNGVPPSQKDSDHDGIPDLEDNCPLAFNPEQEGGGVGDVCDEGHAMGAESAARAASPASETDGVAPTDQDQDGVPDPMDACPQVPDPLQHDLDRDGLGDACDPDLDGDGVPQLDALGRLADNCPTVPNADQADADSDGLGDFCDPHCAECAGAVGSGQATCTDCDAEAPCLDCAAGPEPAAPGLVPEATHTDASARLVWPWALAAVAGLGLAGLVVVVAFSRRR